MPNKKSPKSAPPKGPSVFNAVKPYGKLIAIMAVLSVAGNGLSLWLPKIVSGAIDDYAKHTIVLSDVAWRYGLVSAGIFILIYGLSIVQSYASELVARDIRNQLAAKISKQSYSYVQQNDPAKLLSYLTSDMDAVKLFVSQAIVSLISSVVLVVGGSILLIRIDWRLALAVLAVLPIIAGIFFVTLGRVHKLFLAGRDIIDRLNRTINESILGAALIRVLNSVKREQKKFEHANADSRDIGYKIVGIFAGLIPTITFLANIATLVILMLGGHYVITHSLSLGNFAAFNTYIGILIFPILVFGFIGNIIAAADASYARIVRVLETPDVLEAGTLDVTIKGDLEARNISWAAGGKDIIKDVSFSVQAGERTAIIGPTAAGKSQLLYMLTGLVTPDTGTILIDGHPLEDFNKTSLRRQVGFVFQDSIIFNLSLRENIAFTSDVAKDDIDLAIQTAELSDLVKSLPQGLETVISERGTSLSGGQKQRLMLARALVLNPKILLLDDFTARVDAVTEAKILANVAKNYPKLTLISVTQKITSVEGYDQIILLMEGELLANGTHQQLVKSSPEYMQIYNSQRSTTEYELHA